MAEVALPSAPTPLMFTWPFTYSDPFTIVVVPVKLLLLLLMVTIG